MSKVQQHIKTEPGTEVGPCELPKAVEKCELTNSGNSVFVSDRLKKICERLKIEIEENDELDGLQGGFTRLSRVMGGVRTPALETYHG